MKTLRRWRAAGGYDWWERHTDIPLTLLAVVFVVVLVLPLAHPLTPAEARVLQVANAVIWFGFAVDYLARLYLAPARWPFVRRHPLDLLVVVVPFLRPLRLARLARLLRLVRVYALVVSATRRAGGRAVRQVTVFVALVSALILATTAVIVYDAERRGGGNIRSLGDAFWWALATVTTVGYGDRFPVTTTGRVAAGVLMLTGIALAGVLTASVAAWFVNVVGQPAQAALEQEVADDQDATAQQAAAAAALAAQVQALTGTVEALRAELATIRQHLLTPGSVGDLAAATGGTSNGQAPHPEPG
ncbi:MAG: potassium channel family protein [Motilibacteraceae bacterium]